MIYSLTDFNPAALMFYSLTDFTDFTDFRGDEIGQLRLLTATKLPINRITAK